MARFQISGLQPFNESVFYNCTYPIRFAVLRYYGRPITALVFNEHYRFACTYDSEYGRSLLYCTTHFIEEIDNVLTGTLGVSQIKHFHCRNVVADLEESLAMGRPVMLMLDRYYQSLVPQYYQREHFLHSILVYGYDNAARTFLLFDDLCQHQSNQIVACSASYEEITQAYASCHEHWAQQLNGLATFVAFSAEDSSSDFTAVSSQAREAYILHLLDNRTQIEGSLGNLVTFAGLFGDEATQGDAAEMLRYYYHVFRRMAEIKETQRYQCKHLLNGEPGAETVIAEGDVLMRAWNVMRIRTMRASADPNRDAVRAYVSDISAKLQAIIPLEQAQQCAILEAVGRLALNTRSCRYV
jgi:hypothetical protein